MFALDLPLLVVAVIAFLALLLSLWQLRLNKKMGAEIAKLQQLLAQKVVTPKLARQPEVEAQPKPSFSASLNQVEQGQNPVTPPSNSAEKYRYVASLANQGVDAQGIAAALQMAPAEVEQLLQLARLKQ